MLDPKSNPFDFETRVAAGIVHFGAAVKRSAAGTSLPVAVVADEIEGIADWDLTAKDRSGQQEGFYAQYDSMPIITAGKARAWIAANGSDTNITSGDYLEVADLGATPTGDHGILEEAGSSAGTVRTAISVARAMEDITMGSATYKVPASNVAVGDTTITFTAANLTLLDLSAGDFILLEDLTANLQVNRVKSLTSTVITLQMASTVALTAADSDLVTKMFQCEVMLL